MLPAKIEDPPWLQTLLTAYPQSAVATPSMEPARVGANGDLSTESMPLGTASWMPPQEAIGKFSFNETRLVKNDHYGLVEGTSNGQFWIGEIETDRKAPLGYKDDRHILVVSGTRGGKGAGIIVPNLCLWPGSTFVIDPKGENAAVTAQRRGDGSPYVLGLKQKVFILDPYDEVQLSGDLKRSRFNPLSTIDPLSKSAVADAGLIAASIFVAENDRDRFFAEATCRFITALILHVLTADEFDGHRNLVTVWGLVNKGDWLSVELLKPMGRPLTSPFGVLWEGMTRNNRFNGLIAGIGQQMIEMADKTRDGVLKTAATNLSFIDDEAMQSLLEVSDSDFKLNALKTDPEGINVYLTMPRRYFKTHYRWLRMMADLAVAAMEKEKTPPATGFPTLFVLDEFPGLKRMEVIEQAADQAAGFGVKFVFIVQRLGHLAEHYKESWEAFVGNAGLKIFFSIDDEFTSSYLSRRLGEYEVRRNVQSGSEARSAGTSLTKGISITKGETTTTGTSQSIGQSTGQTQSTSHTGGQSSGYSGSSSNESYTNSDKTPPSQTNHKK